MVVKIILPKLVEAQEFHIARPYPKDKGRLIIRAPIKDRRKYAWIRLQRPKDWWVLIPQEHVVLLKEKRQAKLVLISKENLRSLLRFLLVESRKLFRQGKLPELDYRLVCAMYEVLRENPEEKNFLRDYTWQLQGLKKSAEGLGRGDILRVIEFIEGLVREVGPQSHKDR